MKRAHVALCVVAIFALFGSTEVMGASPPPCAQSIPPTCCTFVDSSGNPHPSNFGLQVPGGDWPIQITDSNGNVKYKWVYQFTGTPMQTVFTIAPVCDPPISTTVESGSILSGVQFPLTAQSPNDYLYTDKKAIGMASFQIKGTTKTYYCRAIAGPVCAPPGISPDLLPCINAPIPFSVPNPDPSVYIIFNPVTLQLDYRTAKDCNTGCATGVEECQHWTVTGQGASLRADCDTWVPLQQQPKPVIDQKDLESCFSPFSGQTCQECMIFSKKSPGCYTYSSGGVTYKLPRGCQ